MRAKKRFGQNFLQDPLIIGDIVGLVPIKGGLHILEIGPGQGALTRSCVESTLDDRGRTG